MADWRRGCRMEIQATPLPLARLCPRPWKEVGVGMEKDRKISGVVKTNSRVDG